MRWRTLMLLRRGHGLYISLDKVNMCHRVILWSSAKACHGFGQTYTVFFLSNHSSATSQAGDTSRVQGYDARAILRATPQTLATSQTKKSCLICRKR